MPSVRRSARTALVVVTILVVVLYLRTTDANTAGCRVVSQRGSDHVLLKGTVLTTDGAIADGCVLIKNGKIVRVGRSRAECRGDVESTVVQCTGSVISPGFVNTHEHLDYGMANPLHSTGQLYNHRHDWRVGTRGYRKHDIATNGTELDASTWGELRHLFSGTTSIVGSHMAPGLVRNLDFQQGLGEGLDSPASTNAVFPLDDIDGILRNGDCDYGPDAIDSSRAQNLHRYIGHIGEGVDAMAENEFHCLSDAQFDRRPLRRGGGLSTDIISSNLALVHALGLSKADFDLVAKRGAKVVWSPRSNIFLYGKTLDVKYLLEAGITVALGTDWLPSGSATMTREAVCALSSTKESYGYELSSETLWKMMTINAAQVAGFEDSLGSITPGKLADIAVFSGNPGDPFAQAVYAPGKSVELVMRGGKVLVASSSLRGLREGLSEGLMFGNVQKSVWIYDELKPGFSAFERYLDGAYPAILPGVPPDEPSCEPSR